MQKRMHHEVMIDAQTLYSVVKAAYPEVTHPQLVVTESDVSYRLCDGYITPNLDLRLRGQYPAVPVVLLCEALATKEQAIDHALRILEEHFAYHEVYRFRDPEVLQQEVRNALDTDAVYTPYVLLNSTWKDYSPLSVVLRKVEIPPVGSLGY